MVGFKIMTDFKEFLFTDDFKAYRKKQVQVIAKNIHNLLSGIEFPNKAYEIQGALEMAQKIISLPSTLLNDKQLEQSLNRLLKEDMAGVTKYLIGGYLEPE